MKIYMDNK